MRHLGRGPLPACGVEPLARLRLRASRRGSALGDGSLRPLECGLARCRGLLLASRRRFALRNRTGRGLVLLRRGLQPRLCLGELAARLLARLALCGGLAADAFALSHVHHDVVPPASWDRALAIAEAVQSDPLAGPMVRGGYVEQRITWTDEETGILCRGRVDHVNGRVSDLKTSRIIEPRAFASVVARMAYHGQIAYYTDGMIANGVTLEEPPALVVVENVRPYDVAVFVLDDAALDAGRALYRSHLRRLVECRERDEWPGVSGGALSTLSLPTWATQRNADAVLTMGGEPLHFTEDE